MSKSIHRVGILTGGGDCPGLNAVIRAITKSAIFDHGLEVWGIEDGFLGLIRNHMHQLKLPDVSNILTRGGTILGTTNLAAPHHYPSGHDAAGNVIIRDVTDRVLEHITSRKLDLIFVIGGDGTMSGASRLIAHGVKVIGVPKTIDNDLMHTEMTFGFQTAVEIATEALDRIHTTAASHHRVMLVETMGRNAGWLALHSGIASGADVILLPEIPYDIHIVAKYCQKRARNKIFTIIAVSEGARPRGGDQVVDRVVAGSPEAMRLGGVSRMLGDALAQLTELETRHTVLGHVQRGGTPCAFDRVLATVLGHAALECATRGEWNQMIAVQKGRICHVPIESVAEQQRTVPLDAAEIAAARAVGTCFGDC